MKNVGSCSQVHAVPTYIHTCPSWLLNTSLRPLFQVYELLRSDFKSLL